MRERAARLMFAETLRRATTNETKERWAVRRSSCEEKDDWSLEEVSNDWVFAMTGWRPDHSLLHDVGVRTDANKVFIENGRHHGAAIVAALRGRGPA